jgi:hypothetical protein
MGVRLLVRVGRNVAVLGRAPGRRGECRCLSLATVSIDGNRRDTVVHGACARGASDGRVSADRSGLTNLLHQPDAEAARSRL